MGACNAKKPKKKNGEPDSDEEEGLEEESVSIAPQKAPQHDLKQDQHELQKKEQEEETAKLQKEQEELQNQQKEQEEQEKLNEEERLKKQQEAEIAAALKRKQEEELELQRQKEQEEEERRAEEESERIFKEKELEAKLLKEEQERLADEAEKERLIQLQIQQDKEDQERINKIHEDYLKSEEYQEVLREQERKKLELEKQQQKQLNIEAEFEDKEEEQDEVEELSTQFEEDEATYTNKLIQFVLKDQNRQSINLIERTSTGGSTVQLLPNHSQGENEDFKKRLAKMLFKKKPNFKKQVKTNKNKYYEQGTVIDLKVDIEKKGIKSVKKVRPQTIKPFDIEDDKPDCLMVQDEDGCMVMV